MRSRVGPEERPLPLGFDWPNKNVPVAFIDISSATKTTFPSSSSTPSTPIERPLSEDLQTNAPSLSPSYSSSSSSSSTVQSMDYTGYTGTFTLESSNSVNSSKSFSYSNAAEADVLCRVVQGLLKKGVTLDQVTMWKISDAIDSSGDVLVVLFCCDDIRMRSQCCVVCYHLCML